MPDLRKRLIPAILAALMMITAAACGDDSSPSESDEPEQVGS